MLGSRTNPSPSRGRRGPAARRPVFAFLAALAMITLLAAPAGAQSDAEAEGAPEGAQELAERHAPILVVRPPSELCKADGERFLPIDVDALLDNDQVLLRQVGREDPVVERGPSAADLFDHGEGFYLDFPGGALAPGCIYDADDGRFRVSAEGDEQGAVTVYAHIATEDGHDDKLALQYWFFYYYNDYNNRHEGDWEGIQLLFDVGTVAEALDTEPASVGFAQHSGGELATWDGGKLELDGDRPVVYPSVGSHASYFGTQLYIGRSGSEGFGCDDTQSAATRHDPEVVVLPDEVTDPDDPLAWLDFDGRWGERHSGPFNGPKGPTTKSRWTEPITWHDELRTSSVIIPGGADSDAPFVNTFCSLVAFGSQQYINALQNPLRLLLTVAAVGLVAAVALTRTDWNGVAATPIVRRRRVGQIVRVAGRTYRQHPRRFITIGLFYMPVALLFAGLTELLGALTPTDSESELLAFLAFLLTTFASLGQGLAYVLITAAFAAIWLGAESGKGVSGPDGVRAVIERRGDLARTYLRLVGTIILLTVTIIGIPRAIHRIIAYQLFGSVMMVEGLTGRAALQRSVELVKGRWLHTAFAVTAFSGLVSLANATVGLVLLIVLAGFPLWLFSLVAAAASALVAPISAVGYLLLYGDARAEADDAPDADPADTEDDDPLDPEVVARHVDPSAEPVPH
ncbi:MAG: hypothetical protein AAF962_02975 [Actinomycetota bacterium]